MQMDELTQQNAALVEQATAASQSHGRPRSSDLNEMMARYDCIGAGEQPAASSARDRSRERSRTQASAANAARPSVPGQSTAPQTQPQPRLRPEAAASCRHARVARPPAMTAEWQEF